jgi:hypothetical protein
MSKRWKFSQKLPPRRNKRQHGGISLTSIRLVLMDPLIGTNQTGTGIKQPGAIQFQ